MNESGQWTVDLSDDNSGVIVTFDVIGESGVEAFTTGLPIRSALDLGTAILTHALAALEDQ